MLRANALRMGGRGACALAVALWAGMACGRGAGAWGALALLMLACAAWALAARALHTPRVRAVLVALVFALLGAARLAACDARLGAARSLAPQASAMVRVLAVVDEPPRRESDTPAATVRVLAAAPRWPTVARLTLRLPVGSIAEWGDTLEALARVEPLSPQRVPGGYDARAAGACAARIASGRAFAAHVRPARGWRTLGVRALMRVRRACEHALARSLSPSTRALAAPLLFGDRGGMDPDTDAMLRASGLVHLLALSGLHVAWLAGVARAVAALLGAGVVGRACAGAVSALLYAGLAGPIPSLARAVAAEAATALARATGRALDPLQSLALACIVLLALWPAWAGDLGFQLSCAATLGLVAVGSPLVEHARLAPRGLRTLARLAAPTLGAQLVALPWLLARFHALPWTSLFANLVAVPVSELLLAAAGLGAVLDAALPGAGSVWLHAAEPLAACLGALIAWLGGFPYALLPSGRALAPTLLATLAAALAVIALADARTLDARGRASAARTWCGATSALCAVLALLLAFASPPLRPPRGAWWCVAIDVGQGDAIAIGTQQGWWLVDTGPRSPRWDAGEGAVLPFLRWAGVRQLDALALTHDDGDHTGGAHAVARGLPVRAWWASAPSERVPGPGARFHARTFVRGARVALAPGGVVRWPPRITDPARANAERGDNASSLVLELGEGAGRVLLTGDADSLVEAALHVAPGVALLKAGHHGSGSSSGAAFVQALRPERVIVSCGAHNPYGHPDRRALERLASTGATLDRTDHDGTLWYECAPSGVRRLDWRGGEPWRPRHTSVPASGAASAPRAR
ncbi:MAG: DNA internalization-related competence protein ComEC/Rec2 [Candidatus Eisenbacteria bacterium]|nr:DNA internalization-related competence protein ComEC/Rec2 [Candidatus Eisenbacteria bacterium]